MTIELIVFNYLKEKLDVLVDIEKPSPQTGAYVVIDKTGGAKSNHLPDATIAFQSYGKSKFEAMMLNEKVKETVENMIELDEIRGLNLNSDYYFPDLATKEYRYQAVYDIRYY